MPLTCWAARLAAVACAPHQPRPACRRRLVLAARHALPLPDRAARLAGGTLKVWDEAHMAARSPLLVVGYVHMAAGQLLLYVEDQGAAALAHRS
jgi:hypothetical protein